MRDEQQGDLSLEAVWACPEPECGFVIWRNALSSPGDEPPPSLIAVHRISHLCD